MSRERGAELGDFTANRRLLVLIPMALLVGGMAALVAAALVRLIDIVTNLAYYQRFSSVPASPADHHLGWAAVLVPMIGGLVIGVQRRGRRCETREIRLHIEADHEAAVCGK